MRLTGLNNNLKFGHLRKNQNWYMWNAIWLLKIHLCHVVFLLTVPWKKERKIPINWVTNNLLVGQVNIGNSKCAECVEKVWLSLRPGTPLIEFWVQLLHPYIGTGLCWHKISHNIKAEGPNQYTVELFDSYGRIVVWYHFGNHNLAFSYEKHLLKLNFVFCHDATEADLIMRW